MALAKGTRGTGEPTPTTRKRRRKRRPTTPATTLQGGSQGLPRSRAADTAEAAAFVRSRPYKRTRKRQERKRAQLELARAIVSLRERQQTARERTRGRSRDPWAAIHRANALSGTSAGFRIAGKAAEQIGESIVYSPAGIYELGKATGLDVRDIATGRDRTPSRTARLGKAVGEQIVEDVRHPGENPGYLALDALAALSLGAGGATRVGAAGRAASKAKGARRVSQALVRKPSEGGSLLRRPAAGREEIAPGVFVNLSRSPAAAAVQRARIKRQKRRPEGSMRGVAGLNRPRNLPERVGYERRRRERIIADIERAPAEGLRKRARKLDRVEQTAIRVIGEGRPLERRIARHEQDIVQAKSRAARKRVQRKRDLLIEVHRRGLVKNVDGKPRPGNRKIAEAYELTRASGARREGTLERLAEMELPGGLTREQAEARRAAPGRVIEGAEFVRTPAQRARPEHVREYEVGERQVERPRTEAEARDRLTQIEEAYETTVRGIEEQLTGGQPADMTEVGRRNLANARLRGKRRGQPRTPTVKQDVRRLAEEHLGRLIESRPDDPTVARFAAMIEERNRLRETLTDPERVFGSAQTPTGAFGAVRYTEPEKTIRRRFPELKSRPALARLEGSQDVPPGELYVPYGQRRRMPTSRARAGTEQGLGMPAGNVLHGQFTGAALRSGRFPDKTVRAVADAELEAQRYRSVLRIRDQAVKDSIDAEGYVALPPREQQHYIPVRTVGEDVTIAQKGDSWIASYRTKKGRPVTKSFRTRAEAERAMAARPFSADTREFLDLVQRKLDEGQPLTRKERQQLSRRADKGRERIFPDLEEAEALAAAAKGQVRFVDERTLGGLNKPQGLYGAVGKAATVADEINAASQIAILHLKPAYLTPNVVGQSFLALAQQGALAPWNMAQAVRLFKALTPEERAKVRAAAGLGLAKALPVERARLARPLRDKLAHAWEKVLDSPFRWPAFVHEARLLGYNSPAKIRQLLGDESKLDDLVEASQRTRDAMLDYANMGLNEEKLARRVIFFYPFMRASATYTGRFARDHPVQTEVLMQLAREGQEEAERELGDVPWYARGSFKVGEDEQGRPLVVNPRAATLFETPVQAVEVGKSLVSRDVRAGAQFADFLTPAVAAGLQIAYPHDPLGGYPLDSVGEGLSRQLVEGLPQWRLQEELRHPTGDEEDRLYPTSRAGALKKFGVGTIWPRPANVAQLNQRAREEGEESLSPGERAFRDVFKERTEVWQAAKRVADDELEGGRLPKDLRAAFTRKATVAQLRAELDANTDPGIDRELAKYEAEAGLLARWNVVDRDRVREAIEWARNLQDIPEGAPLPDDRNKRRAYDELKNARARLVSVSDYFPAAYGDRIGQAYDFLEERGAILD